MRCRVGFGPVGGRFWQRWCLLAFWMLGLWCGVAYASFSKVTAADFGASSSPETGVMDRLTILPLFFCVSFCLSGAAMLVYTRS